MNRDSLMILPALLLTVLLGVQFYFYSQNMNTRIDNLKRELSECRSPRTKMVCSEYTTIPLSDIAVEQACVGTGYSF